MYPGQTTRLSRATVASATSIDVGASDFVRLTGTTAIATITQRNLNKAVQAQILFILPLDGNVATTTAGNIAVVQTMLQNRITVLIWDPITAKWYPHALA
jgi:hypothetical protein